jgi:hypothetical protein
MKADAIKRYFERTPRPDLRARLLSVSREAKTTIFEVEIEIDIPQRPLYPIKSKERVKISLPDDDSIPRVYALRKNFPQLPHMMVNGAPHPKMLCLYQQPWLEERNNWSPRGFIERIRHWFHATADGTLHPHDQPLEPVLQHSPLRIALPEIPFAPDKPIRVERFFLCQRTESFWAGYRKRPPGMSEKIAPLPVLIVQGPTVQHGIIHKLPQTLGELETILKALGGSLLKLIATELENLRVEMRAQKDLPLVLVLELPKTRIAGEKVEKIEYRVFFVGEKVANLFRTDIVDEKVGRLYIPTKKERFLDKTLLKKISLIPLSVRWHLTAGKAARMNGSAVMSKKLVAIGAGALGSQTTNNLWRGGFGEWTIVDGDDFDAHNPARHLFNSDAVGHPKAKVQSSLMQAVFPDRTEPAALACDYLAPDKEEKALTTALKDADIILDFSASVTVERTLSADTRSTARRMSAFLNQRGDESVLLVEDAKRKNRLIWLEALYYRALTRDPQLAGHFDDANAVAHRYGNGCREISAIVSQDGVALHAGLLSQAIRSAAEITSASITIRRWSKKSGSVAAIEVPVVPPISVSSADWEILIHPDVVREIAELRAKNLPNETGGVLVGVVDRTLHTIIVTGLLPAPPDSKAWPTSFIRGSIGLFAAVGRLGKRSLGNIVYVGEWHSHPDACDATPSAQDVAAVAICAPNTRADGLPTLMMIASKTEIGFVIQPLDSDILHLTKITHPKSS